MVQLEPMLQAVRQAAALCQQVQRNTLSGIHKYNPDRGGEPVTIADYGSQAIICRAIQQHFPHDRVIAEETGSQFLELTNDEQKATILELLGQILGIPVTADQAAAWMDQGKDASSQRVWVIDPIDGTAGFIAMRHYAIGIGILENDQPTGSVIAVPGTMNPEGLAGSGNVFYVRDGAAYSEPLEAGGTAQRIQVSSSTNQLKIVQSFERAHANKGMMAAVRERAGMGDAVVSELDSMEKYALVASGQADAYLRLPNLDSKRPHMSWDHAAGTALVIAAGGSVTDVDGTPLDFSRGKALPNRGMLVSNGKVQQQLIDAAVAVLAEYGG